MESKRNLLVFIAVTIILISVLCLSGCQQPLPPGENTMEIASGANDGGVAVITNLIPNAFGYIHGSLEDALCGRITEGVEGAINNLTSRAFYRFSLAAWNGTNMTFYVKCLQQFGTPGKVAVVVGGDAGQLIESSNLADVSQIWNIAENGQKVAEVTPITGQWMSVLIPSTLLSVKNATGGYVTIAIKLIDETLPTTIESWQAYKFSTYEYAVANTEAKPYITNK